jgi:hypothetical protein
MEENRLILLRDYSKEKNVDKTITILGEIVISLGGAGAIIIALSSFIGKLWSDRYMKKKTAEYDRQLEYYKKLTGVRVR